MSRPTSARSVEQGLPLVLTLWQCYAFDINQAKVRSHILGVSTFGITALVHPLQFRFVCPEPLFC